MAELLAVKKTEDASHQYIKDLENRLEIFAKAHPGRHVADFTSVQVDDWLRSLPYSGVTRNNHKRLLGVLFTYVVSRRYIRGNPAREAQKAKVKPEKPGILTVAQAARAFISIGDRKR